MDKDYTLIDDDFEEFIRLGLLSFQWELDHPGEEDYE